jgi:hypothetical protein
MPWRSWGTPPCIVNRYLTELVQHCCPKPHDLEVTGLNFPNSVLKNR